MEKGIRELILLIQNYADRYFQEQEKSQFDEYIKSVDATSLALISILVTVLYTAQNLQNYVIIEVSGFTLKNFLILLTGFFGFFIIWRLLTIPLRYTKEKIFNINIDYSSIDLHIFYIGLIFFIILVPMSALVTFISPISRNIFYIVFLILFVVAFFISITLLFKGKELKEKSKIHTYVFPEVLFIPISGAEFTIGVENYTEKSIDNIQIIVNDFPKEKLDIEFTENVTHMNNLIKFEPFKLDKGTIKKLRMSTKPKTEELKNKQEKVDIVINIPTFNIKERKEITLAY